MSGKIPESRNLKKAVFVTAKTNLTDRLGYEPSSLEVADELGWSIKEVGRMNNELSNEVTASNAPFDFYGNSVVREHKDKALVDYLYHELQGPEKTIFEHTFGYAGKQQLNNKEIAAKMGVNEMAIHRMKKKMSERIQSYR
jgi:DNA-directed RNA polymerase specialized sigma subunit